MKTIQLTQGFETLVDDDVYEWASSRKWCTAKMRGVPYAVRKGPNGNNIYLHREILQGTKFVDHIDRDTLNNQRDNLRLVTRSQNKLNAKPYPKKVGTLKGCSFRQSRAHLARPWWAHLQYKGGSKHVGFFATELEAHESWKAAAIQHYGAAFCEEFGLFKK